MPNYYLFHQNMRVYGGGNAERNEVFNEAMMDISSDLDKDQVAVAGFTEIMNFGASVDTLDMIAHHLDVNLTKPLFFACGITAFKSDSPEYVAISVHKAFSIQIAGRVLLLEQPSSNRPKWTCVPSTELKVATVPDNLSPDSRGLAYVGGKFQGKYLIVGFMHNMYNLGDRSSAFQALSDMIQLIWDKHSEWDGYMTIFGGDFNVEPRDNLPSAYTVYATNNNNEPVNTTKHHPYDYWIASKQISKNNAYVYTETRDVPSGLSDHGGISLKLPMNQL